MCKKKVLTIHHQRMQVPQYDFEDQRPRHEMLTTTIINPALYSMMNMKILFLLIIACASAFLTQIPSANADNDDDKLINVHNQTAQKQPIIIRDAEPKETSSSSEESEELSPDEKWKAFRNKRQALGGPGRFFWDRQYYTRTRRPTVKVNYVTYAGRG
ncbi:unnamed protein product [Notodromas monacha]|uniref:Uncharacterized protein n=1 Tax=Notodromas monacha TaxID=399045 RepID=A0A7R9BVR1_9CRUS|nr:unnamed protein product [Notodromas monacha]CAG0921117.1 unnamed protein product [Notodromas monacha]